jgi:HTH-type transcriptional regulator / antitoxin HigA
LQFLIDQHGLTAKDLWPVIGSKGITSEILNGKRGISLAVAARLSERFHVPPTVFVDWSAAKSGTA